ncbi:MAG: hypothetical protein O7D34_11840 [Ignavibacteria bacterium]|nr:hypothetical protein [Ignavibacteria bacterium]
MPKRQDRILQDARRIGTSLNHGEIAMNAYPEINELQNLIKQAIESASDTYLSSVLDGIDKRFDGFSKSIDQRLQQMEKHIKKLEDRISSISPPEKKKEPSKNQEMEPIDEFRSKLKGIIPSRLSSEEITEHIEFIRENAKYIPEFLIEEHEKHIREISKPPNGIRRNELDL